MTARHSAGSANYAGDVRHIVGEIKGPTTYRTAVLAVGAEYDADTDRTRVTFVHLPDEDLAKAVRTADRTYRLPTLQEATR